MGKPAPTLYSDTRIAIADSGLLSDLRLSFSAGGLPPAHFDFDAVVFVQGPNRNHLRFFDDDLPGFAASFNGVPFLYNHDQRRVESRIGTVLDSRYEAGTLEMVQKVRLARDSALRDFAGGLIDRFSIGWDYEDIIDSITGESWFDSVNFPGDKVKMPDGTTKVCELYFVKPVGLETSAVNVPAVPGTHVLQQLSAAREEWRRVRPTVFVVPELPEEDAEIEEQGDLAEVALAEKSCSESEDPAAVLDVPECVNSSEAFKEIVAMDSGDVTSVGAQEVPEISSAPEPMPVVPVQLTAMSAPVAVAQAVSVPAASVQADQYVRALAQMTLQMRLNESKLSDVSKGVVLSQLSATPTIEEMDAAIAAQSRLEEAIRKPFEEQVAALAAKAQAAQSAVQGMSPSDGGRVVMGEDEITRAQKAIDYFLGVPDAPQPSRQFNGLRDLYLWMTDDYEFRASSGWSVPRWSGARLAAGEVANLPNMLVNSLTRVMVDITHSMAQYRWYEGITSVVPHDGTTRPVDLIMWNEVQDLPTVGEGEPYREAQLGDSKEQMMFSKRGMWIGLTLEMIRQNDLLRIREVPRKLMRAAYRTRSATMASIFTMANGVGPTMSDTKALFHTDHGNLGTEAFAHATWTTVRQRAFKQTEPGSGKRVGFLPEYLLIPVDLLEPAMVAFGYGQAGSNVGKPNTAGTAQEVNIYGLAENRPKIVVVPEWTDATDWAWMVSPSMSPTLQIGYANIPNGGKHAVPEIFTADDDTQGLLFSNDTLPIKIRDWYGVGVGSYIGLGKQNVAG